MKKIGLFYGGATANTAAIAMKIKELFAENEIVMIQIEEATRKDFESFDRIIVGTSTWFDGELPTHWDELLPEIETIDMTGKRVAIFGLGDQEHYPDNFVDGIGIMAEVFAANGAELVGLTSTEGYHFAQSRAVKNGHFLGLAIDTENQSDKTEERILKWVGELKEKFN